MSSPSYRKKRKKCISLAKNSTYRTSSIRCRRHYDTYLRDTIQELCSFPWKLLDIKNGKYVQATHNPWAIESFVLPGRHSTSLQLTTMQQLIATLVHAASQSYCKPWNMHTNSLGASLVTVNSIYFHMQCRQQGGATGAVCSGPPLLGASEGAPTTGPSEGPQKQEYLLSMDCIVHHSVFDIPI